MAARKKPTKAECAGLVRQGVLQHERRMHKGEKPTKLKLGGKRRRG